MPSEEQGRQLFTHTKLCTPLLVLWDEYLLTSLLSSLRHAPSGPCPAIWRIKREQQPPTRPPRLLRLLRPRRAAFPRTLRCSASNVRT